MCPAISLFLSNVKTDKIAPEKRYSSSFLDVLATKILFYAKVSRQISSTLVYHQRAFTVYADLCPSNISPTSVSPSEVLTGSTAWLVVYIIEFIVVKRYTSPKYWLRNDQQLAAHLKSLLIVRILVKMKCKQGWAGPHSGFTKRFPLKVIKFSLQIVNNFFQVVKSEKNYFFPISRKFEKRKIKFQTIAWGTVFGGVPKI